MPTTPSTPSLRKFSFPVALIALFFASSAGRPAQAEISPALMKLAVPLAEQFGLPGSAVSNLLDQGISLESVTQLLLISEDSKQGLDDVTKLYRDSENDVTKTAEELNVAASTYSKENAQAAIDKAKAKAEDDARKAANDGVNNAFDSALDSIAK